LDSKQRKIRSLRGFFLYALEIFENAKDYEILHTNLQPFFWRKVKNIIRQNKKGALLEFLFGSNHSIGEDKRSKVEGSNPDLDQQLTSFKETMKLLQNQVDSLQEKIIELETQILTKDPDRNMDAEGTRIRLKASERSEQGDSTLNQIQAQNGANFVTLSQISEKERIEIIKTGFQLQAQGKLSFKKYSQSTEELSLFQWKGYSIKYERRTKLYQSLKD
jgi:hypothetical protein